MKLSRRKFFAAAAAAPVAISSISGENAQQLNKARNKWWSTSPPMPMGNTLNKVEISAEDRAATEAYYFDKAKQLQDIIDGKTKLPSDRDSTRETFNIECLNSVSNAGKRYMIRSKQINRYHKYILKRAKLQLKEVLGRNLPYKPQYNNVLNEILGNTGYEHDEE